MKQETKDIEKNIWYKEEYEKAKKIPRDELEDFYVNKKEDYEYRVNSNWRVISVSLFLVILLMGITLYFNATEYPNSEWENYRTFSNEICEYENSELRTFEIGKMETRVRCENKDIIIYKR